MAEMTVVCIRCDKPIFKFLGGHKYSGSGVSPEDFEPLGDSPAPKKGEPMLCPVCKREFYGRSTAGGVCLYLGESSWWPMPPGLTF